MRNIENVTVEGISLVSKDYTPAVPKAETRFALFKAKPVRLQKLQDYFHLEPDQTVTSKKLSKGFKRKKLITKSQREVLEQIQVDLKTV